MRLVMIFLCGLLMAAVIPACSGRPDGVLSRGDMAELLADLHEAEGVVDQNYSAYRSDSAKLRLRQAVYEKHGVTVAEVDTSLAWYGYHIDEYTDVYDRVLEILERRLDGVKSDPSKKGEDENVNLSVDGDTAVVWRTYGPRLFSPRLGREFLSASLSSDRFWHKGDRYVLKFKKIGAGRPVNASLTVVYNDGTTYTGMKNSQADGWQELSIDLDTALTASNVVFAIGYSPSDNEMMTAIDSLTLVRMRRR